LPAGEFRWLTVISPEGPEDVELLLEPNATPIAQRFQKDCYEAEIPAASFGVEDVRAEYERLTRLGVSFPQSPARMGTATVAVLDDTCGNLIQLVQD
ncbi:MAG: VOC family protein, partial [Thermoplasmata archaeon]|nr:VOC family protein [Thermoplasmata archaeon]